MSEIARSGWLVKQGQVVKNWKTRYFVLKSDGLMEYYRTEACESKLGSININDTLRLEEDVKNGYGSGYAIAIVTSTRTLTFITSSKSEGKLWINSIREVLKAP